MVRIEPKSRWWDRVRPLRQGVHTNSGTQDSNPDLGTIFCLPLCLFHYTSTGLFFKKWTVWDLNPEPSVCKTDVMPDFTNSPSIFFKKSSPSQESNLDSVLFGQIVDAARNLGQISFALAPITTLGVICQG